MENRQPSVPAPLRRELEKFNGGYTEPRFLYHAIWTDNDEYVGVFGDGPNGSYEWFIWREAKKENDWRGKFRTSNVGYGSDCAALRDVLIESGVMADRDAKPKIARAT